MKQHVISTNIIAGIVLAASLSAAHGGGQWTTDSDCTDTGTGSVLTTCKAQHSGPKAKSGSGFFRYAYDCGKRFNPQDNDYTGAACGGPMRATQANE